ncbi:MAG TPA: hypothetical protein VE964_04510 [Myxococcales bacterium]|nr:hypothetical protein [Myxococcales bacterium]
MTGSAKPIASPVYDLPVTARSLKAARQIGWQFLVADDSQKAIGVEVHLPSKRGERGRFSQVTRGPHAETPYRMLIEPAARPAELDKDAFTLRLIRTPELSLAALWFHGRRSDVLRPLAPTPAPFQNDQAYGVNEFLALFEQCASNWKRHFSTADPTLPAKRDAKAARREADPPKANR